MPSHLWLLSLARKMEANTFRKLAYTKWHPHPTCGDNSAWRMGDGLEDVSGEAQRPTKNILTFFWAFLLLYSKHCRIPFYAILSPVSSPKLLRFFQNGVWCAWFSSHQYSSSGIMLISIAQYGFDPSPCLLQVWFLFFQTQLSPSFPLDSLSKAILCNRPLLRVD